MSEWLNNLVSDSLSRPITKQASEDEGTPFEEKTANLSKEEFENAVGAFRVIVNTNPQNAKESLLKLYPSMSDDDFEQIKEEFWSPFFKGSAKIAADIEETTFVGATELGQIVDQLTETALTVNATNRVATLRTALEKEHGITEPTLQRELLSRALVDQPLDHRDPAEVFTDTHLQSAGPHTSDPGMVEIAVEEEEPFHNPNFNVGSFEWVQEVMTQAEEWFSASGVVPGRDGLISYLRDQADEESPVEITHQDAVRWYDQWRREKSKQSSLKQTANQKKMAVEEEEPLYSTGVVGSTAWVDKSLVEADEYFSKMKIVPDRDDLINYLYDQAAEESPFTVDYREVEKWYDQWRQWKSKQSSLKQTANQKKANGDPEHDPDAGVVCTECGEGGQDTSGICESCGGFTKSECGCKDCQGSLKQADETLPPQSTPPTEIPVVPTPPPPPTEELIKRKIDLQKKLDEITEHLAELRQNMTAELLPQIAQAQSDEPLIIEALKKIDGMSMAVAGWTATLRTKKGYDLPKYQDILDKVEEVAKEEDDRIWRLIQQLKGTKQYNTPVKPSEKLELKRQKSSLDIEAEPITQQVKEWVGRLANWFKRTFLPELDKVEDGITTIDTYFRALKETPTTTPAEQTTPKPTIGKQVDGWLSKLID